MYKLIITINHTPQLTLSFETWQRAYQSLENHLWRYQWTLDSEIIFRVFNPNGKLIKSIGLLTSDDGTNGIQWDNIENEKIRYLMRILNNQNGIKDQPAPHTPKTINAYILNKDIDNDDLPF